MRNLLATVAVGVVLALFGFALYWICFLSASIVIYYRENRLVGG